MALLTANIYRARTQSITIDEAFTYNVFLDGPLRDIFSIYDANNHVLNTILCRISVWLFGRSEFTLRIPSLLGGLLYMTTVLRLCRRAFGEGWFTFLAFALLNMSPAVLDYMSAARGYGLALAFFFWAILQMLDGRPTKAAAGLALSVASNLTFVFPGIAVGLVYTFQLIRKRRVQSAVDLFLLPGIVVAFAITILPLLHAEKDSFYFGEKDLGASVDSVLSVAWVHHTNLPPGSPTVPFEVLRWTKVLIPITLLYAVAVCFREGATNLLILTTGSLTGSLILLIAGHSAFQLLFPVRRTGLYWIPLFLMVFLLLINGLRQKSLLGAAPLVGAVFLCLAQFVTQLCVRHYSEWPGDASNKQIVREIQKNHALRPKPDTKVGAVTWQLEPGLNFYRRIYHLLWMQPIERNLSSSPCDYYAALPSDSGELEKLPVTRIYEDPHTHAILAQR